MSTELHLGGCLLDGSGTEHHDLFVELFLIVGFQRHGVIDYGNKIWQNSNTFHICTCHVFLKFDDLRVLNM